MEEKTNRLFDILGGRKMALTLLAVAVGTAIELMTDRGLSPTFGTFLAGAVASFSAANVITTFKALGLSTTTSQADAPPAIHPDVIAAVTQLKQESDQHKAEISKAVDLIENVKKIVIASTKSR